MILTASNKSVEFTCKFEDNSFSCYHHPYRYSFYLNYYNIDSDSLIQWHYLTKLLPKSVK